MKNWRDGNLAVLAASLLKNLSQWVFARLPRSNRDWTTQSRRQPSGIRSACSSVRREISAMKAIRDAGASDPKCESSQRAFLNRDDDTYTCDHCYSLDSLLEQHRPHPHLSPSPLTRHLRPQPSTLLPPPPPPPSRPSWYLDHSPKRTSDLHEIRSHALVRLFLLLGHPLRRKRCC